MNTSSPKITIARRVSPNARMPFNTNYCSSTKCRSNSDPVNVRKRAPEASGLAADGEVVEEYRALGDDPGARSHSLEYLVVARVLQSDLHHSLSEVMAIGSEPDGHGAIALSNPPVHRDGHGADRRARDDDERREHPGQEFVLGVVDLGADQAPVQLEIDGCANHGYLSVEHATGKRHDGDMDLLPLAHARHIALGDAGIHPDPRDIRHGIGCRRV